ncbi:hypothetical protein LSH36_401g03021 [Paralvinella palmiformis]|uniref:Conserved oligomeric Golgi complex subunit 1 n=1 Tax=Paralvinella palmiformis TaxID=53620 RepID=A0AAD9JDW7_9ANNE|nr:hypothetical protein LSH36_401g03021 [Paralvinella palmiformis]
MFCPELLCKRRFCNKTYLRSWLDLMTVQFSFIKIGAVSREIDTDALFEKYDIEEIREIEKKTRQDIERKKEDLRVMVGERYRELIEAADTISEMKTCAQNVVHSINHIQDLCLELKQTFQAKTFSSLSTKAKLDVQGKPDENQFYNLATQIKLLMDMPEKIWSAIDVGQYLQATQLFLLARHAYNSLQLGSHHATKVHSWFPVLGRQWAAISHFRGTILQTCRHMLTDISVSDDMTAKCLAAVILLDDTTPRQVFSEFLLARSTSINQLFQSDSTVSVKTQICAVVKTIVTTIHQVYSIFYEGNNTQIASNLLMKILSDVTNKGDDGRSPCSLQPRHFRGIILTKPETSLSAKYLTKKMYDFRPELHRDAVAIDILSLQDNSLRWIDKCKDSVKSGLGQLLGFINTVKALASIRNEVWLVLKEDDNMQTWQIVCQQVVKRPINIWYEFFRVHFMDRTKSLVQVHFDSALSLCNQQVDGVLKEMITIEARATENEHNLAKYIWTEGLHDMPSNMAWISIGSKTLLDGGGLMMKARAYTPAVQGLSRVFDNKIKILLDDSTHYLKAPEEGSTDVGPFDCASDHNDIKSFIEDACENCVKKLIEQLREQLSESEKQLDVSVADPGTCRLIIDRVLLLARFCIGLCELSPNLQQCMMSSSDKPVERPIKKVRGQQKSTENPKWVAMKDQLVQFGHEAYNLWTTYMAKILIREFRSYLLDNGNKSLLRNCTKWDDIVIEEETEGGEKVNSTIQVPMQLSDGIIESYEELLNSSDTKQLTQNRALQLIFDLKVFMNILPRKDDKEGNRVYQQRGQKAIERLESLVDPFDLDVFSPYIQQRLVKQSQRSNILYGSLTSLDHHISYMYGGGKQSSVHQEQHNVLALTTSGSRFPLLPLSIQNRTMMSHPVIQSPKALSKGSPLISPTLEPSSPPPMLSSQHHNIEESSSSFFGQMSTIWFSNVGKNK